MHCPDEQVWPGGQEATVQDGTQPREPPMGRHCWPEAQVPAAQSRMQKSAPPLYGRATQLEPLGHSLHTAPQGWVQTPLPVDQGKAVSQTCAAPQSALVVHGSPITPVGLFWL